MEKVMLKEANFVVELLELIHSNLSKEVLLDKLSDYHENDIADALVQLTAEERKKLYPLLGEKKIIRDFFLY